MLVVQVFIHVKPEKVEDFKAAAIANARQSIQEPGCARFDVIQQMDDPTHFVLYEAYRSDTAAASHKETAHYAAWRDAMPDMQTEDRYSIKYAACFPTDTDWA